MLDINCNERHIVGTSTSIKDILAPMDTGSLFSLLFSHCEGLEIPDVIRAMPSLYMVQTYNSTNVSWPASAAPTGQTNPQFTQLWFLRTNITNSVVPKGILDDDFPPLVTNVLFVDTNLHSLPDQIAIIWKSLYRFNIDQSQLTEFPRAIGNMTFLDRLSFASNHITSIDDGVLDQLTLRRILVLSGNPPKRLPEELPPTFLNGWCQLDLENATLTTIRSWLRRSLNEVPPLEFVAHVYTG